MMRAWIPYVNLLMICLFVTAPPFASATDYVWRNVNVGGGGFARPASCSAVLSAVSRISELTWAVPTDGIPQLAVGNPWRIRLLNRVISVSKASRRIRVTRMLFTLLRECIGVRALRF